ncbi:MAG: response regulator [Deltaproteobacteria bacterium]|nr:response regulator [Deltaproteobacteria bacterium]
MTEPVNILVCEDERLFASQLEETLSKLGHRVVAVASNSEEAIKMAERHSPDLALMDIRLEGDVPGTEVAEILAERFDIPSIYLTAYADDETLEQARKANPLGYLIKPVRDKELELSIEFGIGQHRMRKKISHELEQCRLILRDNESSPGTNRDHIPSSDLRSAAVNSVVGGIAHHLNNALSAMYGYLHWLALCETIPEFEKRHVSAAIEMCDRQRAVIQQLMWATQSASRSLRFVKLRELVAGSLEDLSPYVPKGIVFQSKFEGGGDPVYIDPEAVQAAITAVVLNAIEAVGGTGTITILGQERYEPAPGRFNPKAKAGWYETLTVKDSGKGIPSDIRNRIFEPFFTTRTQRNAVGLGLSVVYGVMQAHGGWISLEHEPASGAVFSLYFPCADKPH